MRAVHIRHTAMGRLILGSVVAPLALTAPSQAWEIGRIMPDHSIMQTIQDEAGAPNQASRADELKKALADIKKRLADQRQDRGNSNRELLAGEIKGAREDIANITATLTDVRSQRDQILADLNQTRADLEQTRTTLEQTNERLAESEKDRLNMIESAQELASDLEARIMSLTRERQQLDDQNADLERQLGESAQQVDAVRQSVKEAWQERDGFETALGEANDNIGRLQATLEQANTEQGRLNEALTQSEAAVQTLNADREQERDAVKATMAGLNGEIERQQAQNATLDAQISELQTSIESMTLAAQEKDQALETAKAEQATLTASLEQAHQARIEQTDSELAQLREEVSILREVAAESISEVQKLGEQLIVTIAEKDELSATVGELRVTRTLLAKELEAARQDSKVYSTEAANLRQQLRGGNDALNTASLEPDETEAADLPQLVALQNGDDGLAIQTSTSPSPAEATVDAAKAGPASEGEILQASLLELNAIEIEGGWLMTIPDGIDFAPGSDDLTEGAVDVLGKVASLIQSYQSNAVRILGHTDSNGEAAVNQRLSERRAQSVKRHLVDAHGIVEPLIETSGFGESKPIASNNSPEGRQANRRVEIYLKR